MRRIPSGASLPTSNRETTHDRARRAGRCRVSTALVTRREKRDLRRMYRHYGYMPDAPSFLKFWYAAARAIELRAERAFLHCCLSDDFKLRTPSGLLVNLDPVHRLSPGGKVDFRDFMLATNGCELSPSSTRPGWFLIHPKRPRWFTMEKYNAFMARHGKPQTRTKQVSA